MLHMSACPAIDTQQVQHERMTHSASHQITSFVQVQTALLTPIAPHWAEHVWADRDMLNRKGFAINAGWPQLAAPDAALQRARCGSGAAHL